MYIYVIVYVGLICHVALNVRIKVPKKDKMLTPRIMTLGRL